MVEDIGKIISNGIETYTKNLNLCIPFVLNTFVTGISALIMFGISFFLILGLSGVSFKERATAGDAFLGFLRFISQHILEIVLMIAIIVLIILFIGSFFMAGAIGMVKQATETGSSELSTMIEAGKKNVVNLFLAEILVGLLYLAGIIFIVPGALKVNFSNLDQLFSPANKVTVLLLIAGFLVWTVYSFILSLLLAVFSYALVVDNLGPVESITTAFGFFKKYWVDVILLTVVIIAISIVLTIINEIMGLIPIIKIVWFFVSLFISVFIFQPLTTVWWVRLYMTRTDRKIYFNDLLAHPNDLRNSKESL